MNYSDFKDPAQKNSRGPAGHWRTNRPLCLGVKVNRIAFLRPLPTFGRELSFRGPFVRTAGSLRLLPDGVVNRLAPFQAQNGI